IFEETLKSMDELVPKRIRWGSGEETFVRPVQCLTALLGTDIIPLRRFGLESGRLSYGHRFHAPAAIPLVSPESYVESLNKAKVWAEVATRKNEIERQIKAEAEKLGGTARIDASLLDEVTALVEWPVVISGRIEERFLELPPEVIVATVETNQRYFTVFDAPPDTASRSVGEGGGRDDGPDTLRSSDTASPASGKLLPSFITISNIESKDVAQVIQGNERVVRPRLSDALFFWQQDLKLPFSDEAPYTEKLASATFQKDLGTVADKLKRIHTLATFVVAEKLAEKAAINAEQVEGAARAARRCKFDLVTKMVYEFPELQGVMGGYYALKAGESQAVADAIREHYLPTQAGTSIPSAVEGQIVALADKLDTLAGIFAIGQKPTASKDPYALRRAALGILRILVEGRLPLDLRDLLSGALQELPAGKRDEATLKELLTFVQERHRAWRVGSEFDGRPVTVEMFEAVAALGITQPLDFEARLRAIHSFWALPEAASLAAAHKRVRNVLKQAGDGGSDVDAAKFESAAESELYMVLNAVNAAPASDYAERLKQLASLKAPVDAFFTGVMVMADDPAVRANRLALLRQLDRVCREVADISCLPG
ncbi:glycine--tRNA ligase subunit beta, partial [Nevskia sp.]|uniref:glycine--tRNA ligase subunit beta n=1 Tax=Nevskia sp. TaxID=1929292 RepID=UPI0025EB7681